jgi:hypothetical protein
MAVATLVGHRNQLSQVPDAINGFWTVARLNHALHLGRDRHHQRSIGSRKENLLYDVGVS